MSLTSLRGRKLHVDHVVWGGVMICLKIGLKSPFFRVIAHQKSVTIIPLNHMKINAKMEMKAFIFQCVSTILYPSLHLHSIYKYLRLIKMRIEQGDPKKKESFSHILFYDFSVNLCKVCLS